MPRWLTSKATAPWRQARCSAIVPFGYDSGISQPRTAPSWRPGPGGQHRAASGAEAGGLVRSMRSGRSDARTGHAAAASSCPADRPALAGWRLGRSGCFQRRGAPVRRDPWRRQYPGARAAAGSPPAPVRRCGRTGARRRAPGAVGGSRPRSVMAAASSDTTPPRGTMLSTVWPPWSRSMISSPEWASTEPRSSVTRLAVVRSSPARAEAVDGLAGRLQRHAGVEEPFDDFQLHQVGVGVAALRSAALGFGDRGVQQAGAGPVVELPVGDARRSSRPVGPDSQLGCSVRRSRSPAFVTEHQLPSPPPGGSQTSSYDSVLDGGAECNRSTAEAGRSGGSGSVRPAAVRTRSPRGGCPR